MSSPESPSPHPAVEFDKIVLITRKTRLEELLERFGSRGQARFYIEHAGGDFADYQAEHDQYTKALDVLKRQLDIGIEVQRIDRGFVPNFLFSHSDVVVTLGQDGLVANSAKYVGEQPIIAVNPDPARFDGVLLPFRPTQARVALNGVLRNRAHTREVTLAEARFADGQRILAFNDLFIGCRTHVSARYQIKIDTRSESHSSSGVIVSTGAGSTGWLSSLFNMAAGIAALERQPAPSPMRMEWEDPRLFFVVREPFKSNHSQAALVAGIIENDAALVLSSSMPAGGVVFSDGIESDAIAFNSPAVVEVRAAAQRARLVIQR